MKLLLELNSYLIIRFQETQFNTFVCFFSFVFLRISSLRFICLKVLYIHYFIWYYLSFIVCWQNSLFFFKKFLDFIIAFFNYIFALELDIILKNAIERCSNAQTILFWRNQTYMLIVSHLLYFKSVSWLFLRYFCRIAQK